MYAIIWKYKISPGMREQFEHEYGKGGSWYKLFSSSQKYLGSHLHENDSEPFSYILIDTWTDRQSYEDFKLVRKAEYNNLSNTFEKLYLTEERIGSFHNQE